MRRYRRPSRQILTTRVMGMMMRRWKWWLLMFIDTNDGVILTALQLQRANLSVHGVLGQVHVAGNCCCNAAVKI